MSETTQPYPSHHISDVDHWGGLPDRNYFTFIYISVFLGFFGIDHFYLRSFATGTQKFIINCFTFGLWYFWDIIQIVTEGKQIRERGLNSPLDWIRGIGRGTFIPEAVLKRTDGKHNEAPKSYILFAILAIFFGWLGADKFYMGQPWQGVTKLISCFNIFLVLFGWMWVVWDAVHAFFLTGTVLGSETYAPLPFRWLFDSPIKGSDFLVKEVNDSQNAMNAMKVNETGTTMTYKFPTTNFNVPMPNIPELPNMSNLPNLPNLPNLSNLPNLPNLSNLPNLPSLSNLPNLPSVSNLPSLDSITNALPQVNIGPSTKGGTNINFTIPPLPTLQSLSKVLPNIHVEPATNEGTNVALPALPALPKAPGLPAIKLESDSATGFNVNSPNVPSIQNIKSIAKNIQKGGGSSNIRNPIEEPTGPGPIIAGALTAIIVAGGLKGTYDILCKHLG